MWWEIEPRWAKRLAAKVNRIMATLDELTGVLADISTEVDKVAADTQTLLDKLAAIPTGGLTPEQQAALDAAVASANTIKTRLTDLDNKVPDPTPPPAG